MNKKPGLQMTMGVLALLAMTAAAGCSGKETAKGNDPGGSAKSVQTLEEELRSKPVELTIYYYTGKPTPDAFEEIFVQPLKRKFPNLSLKMVEGKMEDLIAANQVPDLIYNHIGNLYATDKLDLMEDLTPYIKKYGVDLNRFDDVAIQALKQAKPGQLTAVPYYLNFGALYYNKDLFDKFGVAYPRDGMTWDETIELAKRMTRSDGGVQYKGLTVYSLARFQRVAGNAFYNPQTNKASLDTPEFSSFFDLFMRVYKIPGNELTNPKDTAGTDPFVKQRNLAMLVQNNIIPNVLFDASKNGFNWDVAQYPSLPIRPNTMGDMDVQTVSISKVSKNKDAAMQLLISLMSDEVQMNISSKYARLSALKDPKVKAAFGNESPYLKGKNIAGIFKSKLGISPPRTEITGQAVTLLDNAWVDVYTKGKDINSALREANEALNKFIADQSK
ncbi:MAG: transporter substrate-binding protein [Paenibacillus sp.]|jgi:multiple sugar transport system substrate-binding protein|nr:transporter substrate-binding protein [Paenibacillus sp.]